MTDALSFIIEPLRAILEAIHSVISGVPYAWGFSIIILTVLIRIVLIPLTVKQYTSMRAMQRLQPHIKELQKKYKDDRQKMNEELMKFYRENKVNPFGSCLPLLLQMPIFFSLFYMLKDMDFSGSDPSFFWISNISEGDPYKILVILFIATQFLSSKLMTTSVDKSQQMMMVMMPLVFGVLFLFMDFPAGVLIYWVTTNVWSVGQQLVVMKIIKAREGEEPEPVITAGKKKKKAAATKAKPGSKTGGKNVGKPRPKSKPGSKSGQKR